MSAKTTRRMPPRVYLSIAEARARREVVLDQIRALLAVKQITAPDLIQELGLTRNTAHAHLAYLDELGEAHKTGKRDAQHRYLWAAGRAPLEQDEELEPEEVEPVRVTTVQACQIGMRRDPLVAALFGPARGAAS